MLNQQELLKSLRQIYIDLYYSILLIQIIKKLLFISKATQIQERKFLKRINM